MSEDFFGANFLLGRDSLSGSFAQKAFDIGASFLRYPGGGIAEAGFDLTAPDAVPQSRSGTLDTLTDYLAFAATHGMKAVVVLPTQRYAGDPGSAAADLCVFLDALGAGAYGPVGDILFEIGNEYYSDSGPYLAMDAADYGEIASLQTRMIAARMPDAEIAVQTGRDAADNAAIRAAFDSAAAGDAVDHLVFHEYPWRLDPVAGRIAGKVALVDEWRADGIDAGILMSEWNVGSHPDDALDARHDYGHAQLGTLLEIAVEAMAQGVDAAAIWGLQQRNKTALTADEGREQVWAAAHLFRLMQESLPGKRLIDQPREIAGGEARIYAFEDDTEVTVFIAARDLAEDELAVTLDLAGLGGRLGLAFGERLTPLGEPEAYRPEADIEAFLPRMLDGDTARLRLEADHEIVRLTFAYDPAAWLDRAQRPEGTGDGLGASDAAPQTAVFPGARGHDLLRGGAEEDRLNGGGGKDVLFGQGGGDRMAGGSGDDILHGGAGNDRIVGGHDGDMLLGGPGDDRLAGQAGNDWLEGGRGQDRMIGGAGADVFVFDADGVLDRVLDFAPGADFLSLAGIGSIADAADLLANHMLDLGHGLLIYGREGRIFLRDVEQGDMTADDFLF